MYRDERNFYDRELAGGKRAGASTAGAGGEGGRGGSQREFNLINISKNIFPCTLQGKGPRKGQCFFLLTIYETMSTILDK